MRRDFFPSLSTLHFFESNLWPFFEHTPNNHREKVACEKVEWTKVLWYDVIWTICYLYMPRVNFICICARLKIRSLFCQMAFGNWRTNLENGSQLLRLTVLRCFHEIEWHFFAICCAPALFCWAPYFIQPFHIHHFSIRPNLIPL